MSGFPTPLTAGTAGTITVTARDAYGNVASGYTGTVHLTSTDPQASLDPDYTFLAGDAGVAVFNAILYTAGTQALTAADTADATISGSQAGIEVDPAAADHFLVTAPATAASGAAFGVTLTALDPYGNVDVHYQGTVSWTTSDPDPGVVLPPGYAFSAADAGVHTFAEGFTLVTAGDQTLTATDANGPTGLATVTVNAPSGAAHPRNRTPEVGQVPAVVATVAPVQPSDPPGSAGDVSNPPDRGAPVEEHPTRGNARVATGVLDLVFSDTWTAACCRRRSPTIWAPPWRA